MVSESIALDGGEAVNGENDDLLAQLTDLMVREQDAQPLKPGLTLRQALKGLPAHWLKAVCANLGLAVRGRRPEREKAVAGLLLFEGSLRGVVRTLPSHAREALAFILAEGGVARLNRLKPKFGTVERDGWMWQEHPPESTIGLLRLSGLVYIGKVTCGGRNCKSAVIPSDLRWRLEPWRRMVFRRPPAPKNQKAPNGVFEEIAAYFGRLAEDESEPDIKREWVEGFLKEKEAKGAGQDQLAQIWSDICVFSEYQELTEWSLLDRIPYWAYSVGLEWIGVHDSDFRLSLRTARRLLGNLLEFYRFLARRGIISETAELEKAYETICGGRKLRLVERIPFTGEEMWISITDQRGDKNFKIHDFWLSLILTEVGGSWKKLRAAAKEAASAEAKLRMIRELERKTKALGVENPLALVQEEVSQADVEEARRWFYSGGSSEQG